MSLEQDIQELIGSAQDCPNCDNSGFTVVQTGVQQFVTRDMALDAGDESLEGQVYSEDEFEQEQCQWCYEIENSKFNLARNIADRLVLCTNINCDKGKVITDRVTSEGRFELDDCPECGGKGIRLRKEDNAW